MIAFGPIPSRRLGQSLGINNIPPKVCSFNCVYCQVGTTTEKIIQRRSFYSPEEIYRAVAQKVEETYATQATIDYLTFVPDGEPTLDINLGKIITRLQSLNIKIAVFTNATLLWQKEVREELSLADHVSVKVDTVHKKSWYRINRPSSSLSLPTVLEGILTFSQEFTGELATETMLIKGINDQAGQLEATAQFLHKIRPAIAYLALPTRPPLESWAQSPDEQNLNTAYLIFTRQLPKVECLTGYSGDAYSVSGDAVQSLLDILSVHPMRENEVLDFLNKGSINRARLEEMLGEGILARVFHEGQAFILRKLEIPLN